MDARRGRPSRVSRRSATCGSRRSAQRASAKWVSGNRRRSEVHFSAETLPQTDGCSLDEDFPEPAVQAAGRDVSCGDRSARLYGGYDQVVHPGVYPADGSEGTITATVKGFEFPNHTVVEYAAGVGRVHASVDGASPGALVYARIRGEEFGVVPTPDAADSSSYYPLAVGNEWEYREFIMQQGTTWLRRVITRDTVISGVAYVERQTYRVDGPVSDWGEPEVQFLRFDEERGRVVEWQNDGVERAVTCPLDAAFNEIIACVGEEDFFDLGLGPVGIVSGYPEASEVAVGDDRVPIASSKVFYDLSVGYSDGPSPGGYGTGLGRLPKGSFCFFSGCYEDLTFLRLVGDDGSVREYGARYAVAGEDAPDALLLTLRAMPNPTPGPLAVTIEQADASVVTVEAFDVLGRRVWYHDAPLVAGRLQIEVDARAWAAGTYVLRARSGSRTAFAQIVVRR